MDDYLGETGDVCCCGWCKVIMETAPPPRAMHAVVVLCGRGEIVKGVMTVPLRGDKYDDDDHVVFACGERYKYIGYDTVAMVVAIVFTNRVNADAF